MVSDSRRALLLAALGFLRVPPRAPALVVLHQWLDNWRGIGHLVVGMERLGYAISLKKWHDGAWTCAFNRDIVTSADGFGSGPTPWRAVQAAAWGVVKRPA